MRNTVICSLTVAAMAATVLADPVDTFITADNHYAMFSSDGAIMLYHGRNELGATGSPGDYNWSVAEEFHFTSAGGYMYIAAWSDNSSAQGLLADMQIGGVDLSSGHPSWQVYRTNDDRGENDPAPSIADMMQYVNDADTSAFGRTWEVPFVGDINGNQAPWGTVPNINSTTARWMWVNNPDQPANPFSPGTGYGEMLIFRIAVPTPGAAALAGLGGLAAARRRRR